MASHARRNLTHCPNGGKLRDQAESVDAVHSAAAARRAAAVDGFALVWRECRAYVCLSCRGWHLTSSAISVTSVVDRLAA